MGEFQSENVITNLSLEAKEKKKIAKQLQATLVSVCTYTPLRLAINRHGC
jgi:hypothetical protein